MRTALSRFKSKHGLMVDVEDNTPNHFSTADFTVRIGNTKIHMECKRFKNRFNLFDWPFALIRVLTGYDESWSVRGQSIPVLLVGLDQVDPMNDSLRAMIDQGSRFTRARAEVAFKTSITRSASFVANFRYYRELNASAAISAADMAEYTIFTSAMTLTNGMYVSYSTGRLPFDIQKDQVYELGFTYSFDSRTKYFTDRNGLM